MRAAIVSPKGQIAIPKKIREKLRIKPGDQLTFKVVKGKITLEPTTPVPKSQAWFWMDEIQQKVNESEENYRSGNYKEYGDINDLIKDLED